MLARVPANMHRRQFLATSAIVPMAGCLSSSTEPEAHQLGETVEYDGVEATPDVYTTADAATLHIPSTGSFGDSSREESRPAPDGAEFVLTRLIVEHVGENQRTFPTRRSAGQRDIYHYYREERLSTEILEAYAEAFEVDGYRLPVYQHVLREEGLTSSVYTGKAAGWLMNEIPEGFTPEEATMKIVWEETSILDEEEPDSTTWEFTEDARVTPEEAAEISGTDGTVIEF